MITVEKGGNVTLPCTFSYPKDWDSSTVVKVYWRQGETSPCGNSPFIYNHTEKITHYLYRGRLFMEGNPEEQRTANIRIQNLRKTDGPVFCCRVVLENKERKEQWQNRHGTFIHFKDQFSIEQLDVVPVTKGEDVTIPCYVHYNPTFSDTIMKVTWKMGTSDLCSENKGIIGTWTKENKLDKFGQWPVVNFPEDLSLHVRNVTPSDSKRYCCEVRTRRGSVTGSAHGTEVVVADIFSEFKTHQSELLVELEDSVTINCSYSIPPDRDPMWIGTYWRVGSPSNIYAYHPSKDLVHSNYKGRTELRGPADLHIKGVGETDYATYYCFVVFKFCVGPNIVSSVIQHWSHTTLKKTPRTATTVATGPTSSKHSIPEANQSDAELNKDHSSAQNTSQMTWIIASVVVLLIVIILCVIFIVLKKKGVICRKERGLKDVHYNTTELAPKLQSNSMKTDVQNVEHNDNATGQEDSEGVVYAHLNVKSLQQGAANRKEEDNSDSQVLYADVRRTVH
ncbi:sialic acid-binding Ig-like lectin 12 isoform X2 [Mixophyes fleayi]